MINSATPSPLSSQDSVNFGFHQRDANRQLSFNQHMVMDQSKQTQMQRIVYPTSVENRFIEIIQASEFLFHDNFLKNLTVNLQSFKQKINFFEKLLVNINLGNFDFIRKLCWILSKLYL